MHLLCRQNKTYLMDKKRDSLVVWRLLFSARQLRDFVLGEKTVAQDK